MQTTSKDQQTAVSALHNNFLNATVTKRGMFLTENLHPEFLFTSPRAVLLNKDKFVANFTANPDVHLDMLEITEDEQVVVSGTTAVLTGTATAKFKDKEAFLVRITSTFVYDEMQWKLLAMQETFIP